MEQTIETTQIIDQISPTALQDLERQAYRVVGTHSAVKICGWTKKMIRGEGGCYKLKFYGILSHKCLQMTTSMSCANRCTFCWRGYKAPVSTVWNWNVDEPKLIIDGVIIAQEKLLNGFGGSPKAISEIYKQSKDVKHVALSLTGEPITYPKINEICSQLHARGMSTFLVTNATYPEAIKDLIPITQLYLSLDAPNQTLLKEIDNPLFSDFWERLNKSLEYLAEKQARTCIRVTCINTVNMIDLQGWADLINKGSPDFIEVKGYMFVGSSRQRLTIKHMPYHEDVVKFSKELLPLIPDYEIMSEHKPSRVVCFAKKKFKQDSVWNTWIDFDKFNNLTRDNKEELTSLNYCRPIPKANVLKDVEIVNETTEEMEFWEGSDVSR